MIPCNTYVFLFFVLRAVGAKATAHFFYLLFLGKQKCPQLNEHSTVSINDKSENQQVNRHLLNQNEVQSRIASK